MQGRVLVVDDREPNRVLLKDMLEAGGHTVLTAADGPSALEIAAFERPEVILLDVKMPGMDGFEVCRRLKAMAETRNIPVVFVTANYTEEHDLVHGLELGGYDYLVKPVSRQVLLARVGVMLKIRRSEERIRQMSMVDEFTGLFSKNYVLRRLDEEMERAQRRRSSLVVAMLDLDDFKRINDSYGHQVGDVALQRVSACLKANIRLYDSLGRYGGEEFLLLLPELHESEAAAAIGRLRDKVLAEPLPVNGSDLRVGFSAGVCAWDYQATLEELIRRADTALYAAKQGGKNRTVRYAETVSGRVLAPAQPQEEIRMKPLGVIVAFSILVGAMPSQAEVNCAQVNRYVQTGRSVQDVSETMVIPEEEVRKCQEQAKQEGGEAGEAAAAPAEKK